MIQKLDERVVSFAEFCNILDGKMQLMPLLTAKVQAHVIGANEAFRAIRWFKDHPEEDVREVINREIIVFLDEESQ